MEINFSDTKNIDKILSVLASEKKDRNTIEKYRKEFKELDRSQRDGQVGKVQKDKFIDIRDEEGKKTGDKKVTAVRVPVAFANKIVNTSVAFEFGKPVIKTPDSINPLTEQVDLDWKNARLDYKIQQAKRIQKQETQSAILFYFKDLKPNNLINRIVGANTNRQISARVLDFESGEFYPYFDETGDMKFFVHQFQTKVLNSETLRRDTKDNIWVYDEKQVTKFYRDGNGWRQEPSLPHGFSKIPVVYMSQEEPEHYLVKDAIDRIEVALSKLGNSNDYTGHPILFIEGEVKGLPDKNADGKALKSKIEYDEVTEKYKPAGNAKFLTHDNAPQSVKLELDTLEKYIYAMTSTPDISFTNLKSIGNISEATLELMFLDCTLKKLMNEGQNRTDVERCINIIISGIVTTSKASFSSLVAQTYFNIEFPSVLPNNFTEKVGTLAVAVNAGIMSKEKAVEIIGEADDLEEELEKIRLQSIELDIQPDPVPQE